MDFNIESINDWEYSIERRTIVHVGKFLDVAIKNVVSSLGMNILNPAMNIPNFGIIFVVLAKLIISVIWYRRSGVLVPADSRCRIFHSGDVVPLKISFFDMIAQQRV